jgi:hypothetical protein
MFFIEAATGFRPQLFMTFFAVAALLAYARGWRAGAGALAACSFLCWQPAVVIGAGLVAAAIFERRPVWSVRRIVVGGLAVLLAYEAYFALNGAFREQIYQSYFMGKGLKDSGVHQHRDVLHARRSERGRLAAGRALCRDLPLRDRRHVAVGARAPA